MNIDWIEKKITLRLSCIVKVLNQLLQKPYLVKSLPYLEHTYSQI